MQLGRLHASVCLSLLLCICCITSLMGQNTTGPLAAEAALSPPPPPPPSAFHKNFTTRYDLYFQLVREIMGIMGVNASSPVPRTPEEAIKMQRHVAAGFATHNFTDQAAQEVIQFAKHLTREGLAIPFPQHHHRQDDPGLAQAPVTVNGTFHAFLPPQLRPAAGVPSLPAYTIRRTVWLLWFDGWATAPWMLQEVAKSWERHNPGWEIVKLDRTTLPQYLDVEWLFDPAYNIGGPAASDVIRLGLLAVHGGVWADTTMLCLAPLDSWLYSLIRPTGVWMYHGGHACETLASWFIVSTNNNYIIQRWARRSWHYWWERIRSGTQEPYNYFWMDAVFNKLLEVDPEFKQQWSWVPYLCCENTQSHLIGGRSHLDEPEKKEIIQQRPPWAIKLSRHGFANAVDTNMQKTNAYFAIMQSYQQHTGVVHPVEWRGWPV